LQAPDKFPDLIADECAIPLKESQVLIHSYSAEIVGEAAKGTQNVETASF